MLCTSDGALPCGQRKPPPPLTVAAVAVAANTLRPETYLQPQKLDACQMSWLLPMLVLGADCNKALAATKRLKPFSTLSDATPMNGSNNSIKTLCGLLSSLVLAPGVSASVLGAGCHDNFVMTVIYQIVY